MDAKPNLKRKKRATAANKNFDDEEDDSAIATPAYVAPVSAPVQQADVEVPDFLKGIVDVDPNPAATGQYVEPAYDYNNQYDQN